MAVTANARRPERPDPTGADPSRTLTLRERWRKDFESRLDALARAVRKFLVEDDELGLKPVRSPLAANARRYAFGTDAEKVEAFQTWFRGQVEAGLLTPVDPANPAEPWTSKYVHSAHRQGVVRAFTETRKEALSAKADFYNGTKAEFLRQAFASPEAVSKLRLISTRAYDGLKGVTADMDRRISATLADALAKGLGAEATAKALNENVVELGRARARVLARTEIIHAHAEGQLDGFEDLGVEEVGLRAELVTSRTACPSCLAAAKRGPYTIRKARGLLPVHPNCRCSWAPVMRPGGEPKPTKAPPKPKVPKAAKVAKPKAPRKTAKEKRAEADREYDEMMERIAREVEAEEAAKVRAAPASGRSAAERRILEKRYADEVNLEGLTDEEAEAVESALARSLSPGGKALKLKSVVVEKTERHIEENISFGYSGGRIKLTKRGVEAARKHDPKRTAQFYASEPIMQRNITPEAAQNPAEYIALAVAHEAGHFVDDALMVNVGKAFRESDFSMDELTALSGYATAHPSEALAELHAAFSVKPELLTKRQRDFYLKVLETADPQGIEGYNR